MALRKETVQIVVDIEGAQGVSNFKKLSAQSKALTSDLKKLEKAGQQNTEEYKRMSAELDKLNKEFADLGGAGATMGQLIGRAKNLKREILGAAYGTKRYIESTKELKAINNRLKEMGEQTRGVAQGMNEMRIAGVKMPASFLAIAAGVGVVISKVQQYLSESLDAFDKQAKAEAALRTALHGNEAAFERLTSKASEFQNLSLFGDEDLIKQQAYLANLGLTEEQINDTLASAMDLSAGLGISLESAVKNLSKTFGGLTGELGESIPQLKGFTKEELMAGKAIEFVSKKFKGQAAAAAEAGTGLKTQFDNVLGDIQERVGQFINPLLSKFVGLLKDIIAPSKSASSSISDLQSQFNLQIETLKRGNLTADTHAQIVQEINTRYGDYLPTSLKINSSLEQLELLQNSVNDAFAREITLLAAKEKLVEVQARLIEAKSQEKELQEELTSAQFDFNKKAEEGKTIIGKFDTAQRSAVNSADELASAENAVNENLALQSELMAELERKMLVAKEAGVDLAAALGGGNTRNQRSSLSAPTASDTNSNEAGIKEAEEVFNRENLAEIERINNDIKLEEIQRFSDQENEIKIGAQERLNEQLQAAQKRQAEFEAMMEQKKREARELTAAAFGDSVKSIIGFLSQDEKARKKNAIALKALNAGLIVMDGIKEVTAIWKHAADLGPILGPIVGAARTTAAALRTGLALSKMKGTGFFGGGHTGNNGLFNDNQGRKVVGAVHANEWVSPEWMTTHPDYAPIIQSLETVRKRGFVEGGFATDSTTPSPRVSANIGQGGGGDFGNIEQSIKSSMEQMVKAITRKQFYVTSGQIADAINDEAVLDADSEF